MGFIGVKVEDELERKFRVKVAELGGKRGDLSRYVEEAIRKWLKEEEKRR